MQMCLLDFRREGGVSDPLSLVKSLASFRSSDSAGKTETVTKEAFSFLAWKIDSGCLSCSLECPPTPTPASHPQNRPHLPWLVSSSPPNGSLSWYLPKVSPGTRAVWECALDIISCDVCTCQHNQYPWFVTHLQMRMPKSQR